MNLIKLTPALWQKIEQAIRENTKTQGEIISYLEFPEIGLYGYLTYGACPVQYEGRICDQWFYFRARHDHWSIGIGNSLDEAVSGDVWEHGQGYTDASWMPHAKAATYIHQAVTVYHAGAFMEK